MSSLAQAISSLPSPLPKGSPKSPAHESTGSRSGVYSRAELYESGINQADLMCALDEGRLHRLSRDWFAAPNASTAAVAAVQLGARLGCVSGCQLYGVWTQHSGAHIVLPRHSAVPPHLGATFHRARGPLPSSALYPLPDCLSQVIAHHDAESALITLESACNKHLISLADAHALIASAPAKRRTRLELFDALAESGTETRVRHFLRSRGVMVNAQVRVLGVGRVDLLVGRSLIIECDSRAHHSDYEEDRRRDLAARRLGYQVLRLSYAQIMYTWQETKETLARVIATRKHLTRPAPLG